MQVDKWIVAFVTQDASEEIAKWALSRNLPTHVAPNPSQLTRTDEDAVRDM
jgi:hypothetical protein